MADREHVNVIKRGPEAIHKWRVQHPGATFDLEGANGLPPDLHGADLSGAFAIGADFRWCDLRRANLSGAELMRADLTNADLRAADLQKASLFEANLYGADLTSANLNGTDLSGTNLQNACLTEADFEKATFAGTNLANVSLSAARGLENAVHLGPSSLGLDTLMNSKGRISEKFLRGCGLAPWEISHASFYNPNLTNDQINDIQYATFDQRTKGAFGIGIFLSYSSTDGEFVTNNLYPRLQDAGLTVWLDRKALVAGSIQKQISKAIRSHDVVIVVLSAASIASDWVENELEMARKKERDEGRDVLCPIQLDDSWKAKMDLDEPNRALWRTHRRKLIIDFSNWRIDGNFDASFRKLLRGLKTNYESRNLTTSHVTEEVQNAREGIQR
jgi:uncharacterized protein YjbI with pentapeptide repeats